MFQSENFIFNFGIGDVVDIIIVAFLFYKLYTFIRGTRAAQMLLGMLFIIFVSFVADWLQMDALSWIISSVKTVWVISFVILFQPELRSALAHAGQSRLARYFIRPQRKKKLDEIISAITRLALIDIGALIVIARENNLEDFIETGTSLKAAVSSELIMTIFQPKTPLHDGAVIIKEDTVLAAGCILPLSQNANLPQALGTRHRAAIGLSEESDAIVIVISEETGTISLVVDGAITRGLTPEVLHTRVSELLT